MEFFEEAGVPLKTERGNRVFPVSDHSSDIIRGLERELKKAGAHIHLRTEVKTVKVSPYEEPGVDEKKAHHSRVTGVELADGSFMEGDHVLSLPPEDFPIRQPALQEMAIALLGKQAIK
ncbi:MAG: hypothetical protein ACLVH3_13950 [Blautia obeum]